MNPYTRALLKGVQDRAVIEFVSYWDRLEALVIEVFRARQAPPEVQAEHRELRAWLSRAYPDWQPRLSPYWPNTRIGREPATYDPFAALLSVEAAEGFVKNWRMMQTLPAAREALNQYLLDVYGG